MAEQVFGRIFTREEADSQFGEVISGNEIDSTTLSDLCEKSASVLMFSSREDSIIILGDKRVPLYPDENQSVPGEEVFHVFSIPVILELMLTGGAAKTIIEKRQNHLTITNGNNTMEFGGDCPPYC